MAALPRKQPGVAFWATVVVVAVLVAYPLSVPPVYSLWWKAPLPRPVATAILAYCSPIISLTQRFEVVERALSWYTALWLDHSTPPQNLEID